MPVDSGSDWQRFVYVDDCHKHGQRHGRPIDSTLDNATGVHIGLRRKKRIRMNSLELTEVSSGNHVVGQDHTQVPQKVNGVRERRLKCISVR